MADKLTRELGGQTRYGRQTIIVLPMPDVAAAP